MDNISHQSPVGSNLVYFTVAVGILSAVTAAAAVFGHKPDSREPPVVASRPPWIGHLIGMWWFGPTYYQRLNAQHHLPIYTLPLLTGRTYIVTSPALVAAVQRNTKTLSFYSVIVEVTRRMCAFDEDGGKIILHNMNQEHGPSNSLMTEVHDMMNAHLAPGPVLDEITGVQLQQMTAVLNSYARDGLTHFNLYYWTKQVLSKCNAYAFYGPNNIFATNPSLVDEFWTFEEGMLGLVIDFLPSITARKAYLARKKVIEGLKRYVQDEQYRKASPLIRERIAINQNFGLSPAMLGNAELVLLFGILGNAVPSIFWMIVHIYSRPQLLKAVRDELETRFGIAAPANSENEKASKIITLSAAAVKLCPLLYACYRESLRDISNATSPRLVLEDTMLADKYLLRKNSIVQLQGGVLHLNTDIWGADAASFNPQRFLSSGDRDSTTRNSAVALPKSVPPTAFRAFGGGSTLCPGRHFAQTELMTFIAALVLGFEIEEQDGSVLKLPPKEERATRLAMMRPLKEPNVTMRRRAGWEQVRFDLVL